MPVSYPGDQTHTQAPSAIPQPGQGAPATGAAGSVTVSLPADSDPPNASTYIQAYKVLADFIDFLLRPKAKLSDWLTPIFRWRGAKGHTRMYLDHLGFITGRVAQWYEDWAAGVGGSGTASAVNLGGTPVGYSSTFTFYMGVLATALNNASVAANLAAVQTQLAAASVAVTAAIAAYNALAANGPWLYSGLQTTGSSSLTVFPPDNGATKRHRYVSGDCGDTSGDYAILSRKTQAHFDNDLSFELSWELYVDAVNIPNRNVYVGISEANKSPGVNAQNYAVFQLAPTGNWFCVYAAGGAGGPPIDTTVAGAVGWHRFKIEYHGSNVAEDTNRRVRFYIDEALVGTASVNIPVATAEAAAHFSIVSAGGASGISLPARLGPARFHSNLYAADVL